MNRWVKDRWPLLVCIAAITLAVIGLAVFGTSQPSYGGSALPIAPKPTPDLQNSPEDWQALGHRNQTYMVLLTGLGVALIYRTLHYTRVAADMTISTLREAQSATKAAWTAADAAKVTARATFKIEPTDLKWVVGKPVVVTFNIKNVGQSSAHFVHCFGATMVLHRPSERTLPSGNIDRTQGNRIAPGEGATFFSTTNPDALTDENRIALTAGRAWISAIAGITYTDVFGEHQEESTQCVFALERGLKDGKGIILPMEVIYDPNRPYQFELSDDASSETEPKA